MRDPGEKRERRWRLPRGFQELSPRRIREILLVSSLYDSFTLAEDGQVAEQFVGEFLRLDLLHVPDVTRVSTGARALERLTAEPGRFDLVLSTMKPGDMEVPDLAHRVKAIDPALPVVLLAYDNRELTDFLARSDTSAIERAFLWQGDTQILLAICKYVEDKWNAAHDCGEHGVQAILVVEDNVRYYSSFLPLIYSELFRQTQRLIAEGLNRSQKMLRLRARPKILLCDNYEEAWDCFERYRETLLGIISDIEYPRAGVLAATAGLDLARRAREVADDLPILLQSSRPENEPRAREVGAAFLLKGSPVLLHELGRFMNEHFCFGDFVFRTRDGVEVGRASDLQEMEQRLAEVPADSLAHHGERNHFSNWFKARTEFALAHQLRPQRVSDFASLEALRAHMIAAIRVYRAARARGIVADFDATTFDPTSSLARIGGGSLGGKARGLAFANYLIEVYELRERWPGIQVAVPPAIVLGTDIFDKFLDENDLRAFAIGCDDDAQIECRFQDGILPESAVEALTAYLGLIDHPLAVRSSSLLEDSQVQPLAGVYDTCMLPNNHGDRVVRQELLLSAIKRVYASTFSNQAKNFLRATTYRLEEEKMAVIVQKIVGRTHGNRIYPDISGVACSHNVYPVGPLRSDDGIVAVALGFGKTVVEGETCLRFSPRYPRHLVQLASTTDAVHSLQRAFYALVLDDPEANCSCILRKFDLDVAESDGVLGPLASTYRIEDDVIVDGIGRPGVRLISLAGILKHGAFPLTDIIAEMLEIGGWATAGSVEIEFAATLSTVPGQRPEFGLLQMRPLVFSSEFEAAEIAATEPEQILCESRSVLGHGRVLVSDVVVIDAEKFDRGKSREAADEVASFNARLSREGRPYLLIGPGRWGSNDSWLGVPVTWNQISGARVIVEAGLKDLRVEPSQGTHFFQNLSSCGVGYFTVNPQFRDGALDWAWLERQVAQAGGRFCRHLHFSSPLVVLMNGRSGEGRILKPQLDGGGDVATTSSAKRS